MKKRCKVCNGLGKMLGLGMVEKKCLDCNGTGWIENNEPDVDEVKLPIQDLGMTQTESLHCSLSSYKDLRAVVHHDKKREGELTTTVQIFNELNELVLEMPVDVTEFLEIMDPRLKAVRQLSKEKISEISKHCAELPTKNKKSPEKIISDTYKKVGPNWLNKEE